jgi:RNA polymerase primary sigma factor
MRQLKISQQITNRAGESLERYLQEIGRIPLLTADEEVILARRIREGDSAALEKMVNANLRFVVSVAKQFQGSALPLGDLINEGNLGLVKAATRFDETRGFKFISYAVWWIRQAIMQAIAEQSRVIRIPLNRLGSLNKLNRTFSSLEQQFQREPSPDELAEVLQIDSHEVVDTARMGARHVSLHAPFVQGEEHSLIDTLEEETGETPDGSLMQTSLQKDLRGSLSTLKQRQSEVIELYYGLNGHPPLSLQDIGFKLNLTQERVRQIKEQGIARLRDSSKSNVLKNYLG